MVPAAPSGLIELARVPAADVCDPHEEKEECTDMSYHRSSHVVRRWTTRYAVTRGERGVPTASIVHELIDQWLVADGSFVSPMGTETSGAPNAVT